MKDIFVNCMEKVETGGNIRIFAYFTTEGHFFALHGDSGKPLTTVTEVTHLSETSNRGDAQTHRARLEAAIQQRERERFTYVGYRKLLWDGSLGEVHMGNPGSIQSISLEKLPSVIRSRVSEIIAKGKPRIVFTASVKGETPGKLRMVLQEAAIALKDQGVPTKLDDLFNLRIGSDYTGSLAPVFPNDPENTEFVQNISDQEIKGNHYLPVFFWAIVRKMLGKENCTLADRKWDEITDVVAWTFKEFGYDADIENLAIQLGLQLDRSKINVESASF